MEAAFDKRSEQVGGNERQDSQIAEASHIRQEPKQKACEQRFVDSVGAGLEAVTRCSCQATAASTLESVLDALPSLTVCVQSGLTYSSVIHHRQHHKSGNA